MLHRTLHIRTGVDIKMFAKVQAFLKRKSSDHESKKFSVFTRADIESFLCNADNENYLHVKVITLFSLFGACRKSEILALALDDVVDAGVYIMVRIRDSKTGPRSFIIVGSAHSELNALVYFRQYLQICSANAPTRLFFGYRNGKCTRQPICRKMIATYPKKFAEFSKLQNTSSYTSHAFRRSSATWLVDSGVDILNLKRFGGWKSDTSAQGYIAESIGNKRKLAEALKGEAFEKSVDIKTTVLATTSMKTPPINIAMCENCTFNITINEKQ